VQTRLGLGDTDGDYRGVGITLSETIPSRPDRPNNEPKRSNRVGTEVARIEE